MRNRDIQQSSRHDLAPNPFKRQLHKMVKHTQTICGLLPMPTNYLSLTILWELPQSFKKNKRENKITSKE